MVMWHITLNAQWCYRHTPWNALDLNARPRDSYRRIDLFMVPPPNTYTTTFDRPPTAVPGTTAVSDMYCHYVESIVSLLHLMNTEWQHMDRSIGGHSKVSRVQGPELPDKAAKSLSRPFVATAPTCGIRYWQPSTG